MIGRVAGRGRHLPRALLALLGALLLGGCSSVCDRDKLPNAGDASTPERLADLLLYSCKNECWGTLYDHVSAKTKDRYSYVEFRVGFPRLEAPGTHDKVAELLARSSLDVVSHWHWGDAYRLAILSVPRGGEKKDLNVILVQEPGEGGVPEWHVALAEQVDRKVSFD